MHASLEFLAAQTHLPWTKGDVVSNVLFKKLRLRELKHQTDAPPERTQVDSGLAQVIVENADLAALGPQ